MRVMVTGSQGFVGKNLCVRLREQPGFEVVEFTRADSLDLLPALVNSVDAVVHLAGENRPQDPAEFERGNTQLTQRLCATMQQSGRVLPFLFSSSTQALLDNPYGQSKRGAELAVEALAREAGSPVAIYRLSNVFGKWCRPNYNSVVANFCHGIANGLPITIRDPSFAVRLVYVDDVVSAFIGFLANPVPGISWPEISAEYEITLGALAQQIRAFENCRSDLVTEPVGTGLVRALYATYVSYLPTARFSYPLAAHRDPRGAFVEMLKTRDSGQFSFFSAHPGVTRGGHYHHTKTEKFLVIRGKARFGFRHILTNECYELLTSGDNPQVVETIPGWTHDITNIGDDEMLVMLWANEIFDRASPDTIFCKV